MLRTRNRAAQGTTADEVKKEGQETKVGGPVTRRALGLLSNNNSNIPTAVEGREGAKLQSNIVKHRPPFNASTRVVGADKQKGSLARPPIRSNSLLVSSKPTVTHRNAAAASKGDVENQRPVLTRRATVTLKTKEASKCADVVARTAVVLKTDVVTKLKEELPRDESVISSDSSPLAEPETYSSAMIRDIDADDGNDPQLIAGYVQDVYDYLKRLERAQPISRGYLTGSSVTPRMRDILVDWLVQVHIRFNLLSETFYMTVALIDRYLQARATSTTKERLQLVGVTAMFIASKYEEIYAPEINDFVYITDKTYTADEIRTMEREMLKGVNFDLGRPLPIHFLRRYSKAAQADVTRHTLAKYVMELTQPCHALAHTPPSLLAASAYRITQLLHASNVRLEKWSATMAHYTQYQETELEETVQQMARLMLKTHSDKLKLQSVRRKYSTSKFLSVSRSPLLSIEKLKHISTA